MAKKRKLSDFTSKETGSFLQLINNFKEDLSEDDEESKSLLAALDRVTTKLQAAQSIALSSETVLTFAKSQITPEPLYLKEDKKEEIRSFGLVTEGANDNCLTIDQTKALISLIRIHTSCSPGAMSDLSLGNAILLHVMSNLRGNGVGMGAFPEFRMESTKFECPATSYGGVVDYLLVKGPVHEIKFILDEPKLAFANPDMIGHISLNIYEAKREGFKEAVPQAAMAFASYCRQKRLETYRGCVTNGETWLFFVFRGNKEGQGGRISISDEFKLEDDFRGLSMVLALLRDWIVHGKDDKQQFFTYFDDV